MDTNREVKDLFDRHAREYQDKYFDVSLYAESLDVLKSLMRDQDDVLDIGAGPGNVARYIMDTWPRLRYLAADLSPKMLQLARSNNPTIRTVKLDCRDIGSLQQDFDCIISSFCIPYLNPDETGRFIRDAHARLHPGGHLYLSWISADTDRSETQKARSGLSFTMHYYCEATIKSLMEGFFEVIHTQKYISYNKADTDLVVIARKV